MEPATPLRAARGRGARVPSRPHRTRVPRGRPTRAAVHIWYVPVTDLAAQAAQLRPLLSGDELAAADRLHFASDRLRMVCRRGAVRTILGRHTGLAPQDLVFRANEQGKPELAGPAARSGIRFNVARSDGLVVCAVTAGRRVGVDVEAVRPVDDALRVARAYFSPAEHGALRAIPAADRSLAFLRCWTRKEAFVKALGAGLSYPLHAFDVTLAAEAAAVLRVGGDPRAARRWSMTSFDPPGGHVAALVVAGPACEVASWRWFGDVE